MFVVQECQTSEHYKNALYMFPYLPMNRPLKAAAMLCCNTAATQEIACAAAKDISSVAAKGIASVATGGSEKGRFELNLRIALAASNLLPP